MANSTANTTAVQVDSDVLRTYENSVIIAPHQKSFQFDQVFDSSSTQEQVFNSVASNFIDRFVEGYNVTILAYGQTSSGKTYTMGTAVDNQPGKNTEQEGIIPRAMLALFDKLSKDTPIKPTKRTLQYPNSGLRTPKKSPLNNIKPRATSMMPPSRHNSPAEEKTDRSNVLVSFIEIYNEELIDLLNPAPPNERAPVTIREDPKGHIIWNGLREVPVSNADDVLKHLKIGTENRATGSTDMNAKSSRSHAIFSVTLKQEKWVSKKKTGRYSMATIKTEEEGEWMVVNSKFHFVDLAGSERLKRTAAEGDRRKEGININAGLLALGNVISALSDPSKKPTHIPYRDSKLTRLLQDSLGGNSTTLMIACVSSAEINLTETANTIKYAYRARNIRNKSERNETEEWMTSDNADHLRQLVAKLKSEVKSLKSRNTRLHHLSPSSSATDIDRISRPSSSATTNESCEYFEQNDTLVDLRRQIEELQNQVTVTRERNRLVESRLEQPLDSAQFEHLVEPVIKEYETAISKLESQLAMVRAALSHSDQALASQHVRISKYESLHQSETHTLVLLKQQLETVLAREKTCSDYCLELEAQLEKSLDSEQQNQLVLAELREKIIKLNGQSTEPDLGKSDQVDLESLKADLHSLRHAHTKEIEQLESTLSQLTTSNNACQSELLKEREYSQSLQKTMKELSLRAESHSTLVEHMQQEYDQLQLKIKNNETQLQECVDEVERSKIDVDTLQNVVEKQDAIIQGLESKLEEMNHLVHSLRSQLDRSNMSVERLETDNAEKVKIAEDIQKQLEVMLKDVCGMGIEKSRLENVVGIMEGTLRFQEERSEESMRNLEEIKRQYATHEQEIIEKRNTLNLLSTEKEKLASSLRQAKMHASRGDEMIKSLTAELETTRARLNDQSIEREKLLQSKDSQDLAYQHHIEELKKVDSQRQQEMDRIESELHKIKTHFVSTNDHSSVILELEGKIKELTCMKKRDDELWKTQIEHLEAQLESAQNENKQKQAEIEFLELSLSDARKKEPKIDIEDLKVTESRSVDSIPTHASHELIRKLSQLQDDNLQLVKSNESLESQLVLQRSQFTLETRNMELEMMKLTAANDRLEREIEQTIPRNNISRGYATHNRESIQFSSPPQTPLVSSPPPSTSNSSNTVQYKLQKEISSTSIAKLSKSGSYRSILEHAEEEVRRMSTYSARSDVGGSSRLSSHRGSRNTIISHPLPPLTAPPSNPLPPIPTQLPSLPASEESTKSTISLGRQDSVESTSFSDVLKATYSSEQYERLLESLQTKTRLAENEVHEQQKVINKLEEQLNSSEVSVKEIKKQLDILIHEKQACDDEIATLRAQIQQDQIPDVSTDDRKRLEEELVDAKIKRDEAEKARKALEYKYDSLMSKKSKFMCF